jgi:hypothetical protein
MTYPKNKAEWGAIIKAVRDAADDAAYCGSPDQPLLSEAAELLEALRKRTATGNQE